MNPVRLRRAAIALICLFAFSANASASTLVTALRFGNQEQQTHAEVELSEKTGYEVFTLSGPDRLVIDLKNSVWQAGDSMLAPPDSLIGNIRHGQNKPGVLRLVMETSGAIQVTDTFMTTSRGGYKLVVRFAGEGSRDSPAAMGKEEKNPGRAASNIPASMAPGYKSASPLLNPPERKIAAGKEASVSPAPTKKDVKTAKKEKPGKEYKPVIIIDAGHGGMDPGAIGKSGIYEKKITLAYALALRDLLEKSGRYRAVLTRADDRFIKLYDRVRKAQKAKGDLLISLHADSHPDADTRGLSVYTLSERRAKYEANKLAEKAGREPVLQGVNLRGQSEEVQRALIDLAQNKAMNTSGDFASMLVDSIGGDAKLLDRTHRMAGFAVLTGADIPSVLIELGYLSNKHEEKLLRTDGYKAKLTAAIKDAINAYFEKYPVK